MRNVGGRPRTGDGRFKRARALWEAGKNVNQIAAEMKVARATATVYLRYAGVLQTDIEAQNGPTDWHERFDKLTKEYPSFADAMTALMLEWTPNPRENNCTTTPISARSWGMERTWVTA